MTKILLSTLSISLCLSAAVFAEQGEGAKSQERQSAEQQEALQRAMKDAAIKKDFSKTIRQRQEEAQRQACIEYGDRLAADMKNLAASYNLAAPMQKAPAKIGAEIRDCSFLLDQPNFRQNMVELKDAVVRAIQHSVQNAINAKPAIDALYFYAQENGKGSELATDCLIEIMKTAGGQDTAQLQAMAKLKNVFMHQCGGEANGRAGAIIHAVAEIIVMSKVNPGAYSASLVKEANFFIDDADFAAHGPEGF